MRVGCRTDGDDSVMVWSSDGGGSWLEQRSGSASRGVVSVIEGARPPVSGSSHHVEQGRLCAPYRPGTIYGVGLNYADTIREMGWRTPRVPYLFPKLSGSVIGTGEAIVFDPRVTERVDWETELAVVIGSTVKDVPVEHAMEAVFGYTVANDISARDLQEQEGQWLRGKGLDTFCPFGPVVVTKDEVPAPHALRVRTTVNGEVVQDGSTADMVFDIPFLITYLSRSFTLRPGDVILTGTPAGCGDFADPRRSLRDGDVLESTVEYVGTLVNPVREQSEVSPR